LSQAGNLINLNSNENLAIYPLIEPQKEKNQPLTSGQQFLIKILFLFNDKCF